MRALTFVPGSDGPPELVQDFPEPDVGDGPVVVEVEAVGLCGTDHELVAGDHGAAPEAEDRLVLGHESLGRVTEAPDGCGLRSGDLVVGIVREPDPVPCPDCAAGEQDMCSNGRYTEHGIKGRHGFARERYRSRPGALVKVDPALGRRGVLLEPASVLAKAWEQVDRLAARTATGPASVLITGAGPIGLLAALMGAQRGLEVHVSNLDEEGLKPELTRALGAEYHARSAEDMDLEVDAVIECTGVSRVIAAVLQMTGRNGVVCLTGVTSPGETMEVDVGAVNGALVRNNTAVAGTVNANRRHYLQGAVALAAADPDWLSRLITRTVPLEEHRDAFADDDGVKTVLTF